MKFKLTAFFTLIFLSGCALYSKPEVPTPITPQCFKSTITKVNCNIPNDWWLAFQDSQLDQLENQALQNSYDYKIALKNIQIAQTYVDLNIANYFPQINLNASATRNALSQNSFTGSQNIRGGNVYNLMQLYGSASYQVDFWHQVANGVNWAKANVGATAAASDVTRVTLLGNVANIYLQLCALHANAVNLQQQLCAANAIINMNSVQYQGGLENIEPIENAKIQAENIKTSINNVEKQKQISENTLAYLLGKTPEQFHLQINRDLQSARLENLIPPNIPSLVLTQRPDIQSAFYQVLAYGYLEKQALANFFPNFTLTGNLGYASTALSNFISHGSLFWNFGLSALQPLLDFGKTASLYKQAKLQYENAVLNYQNVVLNAFKEVNSALSSYQQDMLTLNATKKQLQATKSKLALAQAQFNSGIIDCMTYQTYRLTYLQTENNVINQILQVYLDVIQVYQALGLGINRNQCKK